MLRDGLKLHYEYDFGSTTELTITVVGTLLRPKHIVLFQQMLLKCCFGNRFPAKIAVSF